MSCAGFDGIIGLVAGLEVPPAEVDGFTGCGIAPRAEIPGGLVGFAAGAGCVAGADNATSNVVAPSKSTPRRVRESGMGGNHLALAAADS